jgi:hypothetical protein
MVIGISFSVYTVVLYRQSPFKGVQEVLVQGGVKDGLEFTELDAY